MAGMDCPLQEERAGPIDVCQGVLAGQLRTRGVLRPARERVPLLRRLGRGPDRGVPEGTRCIYALLYGRAGEGVTGMAQPVSIQKEPGHRSLGVSSKRGAPPHTRVLFQIRFVFRLASLS